MTRDPIRGSLSQIQRLYAGGTTTGLSEGELLERFLTRRDSAAFEALVARHGPMVLGVCKRHLRDPHAIDDAFQATFLILVRRAGSIRDRSLLGNWLYGVARRVAIRARTDAARRTPEALPEDIPAAPDPSTAERAEALAILDEELSRLPRTFSAPIVLCALEGLSHEQAAERLRCPVGTVRSRMARGREKLRERLARRGVVPAVAATALSLPETTPAAVPPVLLEATLRATGALAAKPTAIAAGTLSAGAMALTQGVLNAMFLSKLKLAAAASLLAVAATGGVTAVLAWQGAAATPRAGESLPPRKSDGRENRDELTAEIQVLEAERKELTRRIDQLIDIRDRLGRAEAPPAAPRPAGEQGGALELTKESASPTQRPGHPSVAVPARKPEWVATPGLYIVPPIATGRIAGYSIETGAWKGLPLPEGVKANVMATGNLAALILEGPKLDELAVFDGRSGEWYPHRLKIPASGRIEPSIGVDAAVYVVGPSVHAFSSTAQRWGVLELEDTARPVPVFGQGSVVVEHGDRLYIFSSRTGTWAGADKQGRPLSDAVPVKRD